MNAYYVFRSPTCVHPASWAEDNNQTQKSLGDTSASIAAAELEGGPQSGEPDLWREERELTKYSLDNHHSVIHILQYLHE